MILKTPNFDSLLNIFPIENFEYANQEHLNKLSMLSIQSIVDSKGQLPLLPPFERHPYIEDLIPNKSVKGLMIGTFPPISYMCSLHHLRFLRFKGQEISPPCINYFHGNIGSLWKFTPLDHEFILNHPKYEQPKIIQESLNKSNIVYTDIIKFCQRKINKKGKYDASDLNLSSIIFNEQLIDYIFASPAINRIYFTNASFYNQNKKFINTTKGNLNLDIRDAFTLFIKCLNDNDIKIDIAKCEDHNSWICINEKQHKKSDFALINDIMRTKVTLHIRLTREKTQRIFRICSSVSPAAVNRGAYRNPCITAFGIKNELHGVAAANDFLRNVLSKFFEDKLDELERYNK